MWSLRYNGGCPLLAWRTPIDRKYVWIAYSDGTDETRGQVQAVANTREELSDLLGLYVEGPVLADMYPVGRVFQLSERES